MSFFDLFKRKHSALIKEAFDEMQHMLQVGKEMFTASTGFALDNEILDVDLEALDQKINLGEQLMRREILTHLTVDPNKELIFSLKLLSIVHEAERIGDLCKTIAELGSLATAQRVGHDVESLRAVRNRITIFFENVERCFMNEDEQASLQLLQDHKLIKSELSDFVIQLTRREDLTQNESILLALFSRSMSRVSSHLSNIISTVASPFELMRRSSTWRGDE